MADSRVYKFGDSQLTLAFGDITTSEAKVLVSSDDSYLTMSGGVSPPFDARAETPLPWMRPRKCRSLSAMWR